LLTSSAYINWWETCNTKMTHVSETQKSLIIAISIGTLFLTCQFIEFSKACYTFRDDVFSTLFFTITGLHLTHILLGLILLYSSLLIYHK
jgi:heme/copper-type cytochrome/quinol oxidase subunit 3